MNMQAFTLGIVALGFSINSFAASDPNLGQCQHIKNQIERYTNLKRKGGSKNQMQHWQKSRNEYKKQYADQGCRSIRHKLK